MGGTVASALAQLLQFLGRNIVSVVLVVVTALVSSYYVKRPRGTPPGPRGWPVVGSFVSLAGKHTGRYLQQLSEQYGPIFSLYMGPQFTVVVNDVELAREALLNQGEHTAARPFHYVMQRYDADDRGVMNGIGFSNGKLWKEHRKFALTKLREFGMGKVSIENKIQEEASACLAHLSNTKGEPLDPQALLSSCVLNVIASIIFGARYDYADPAFLRLNNDINAIFHDTDAQGMLNFYPAMRHLPVFSRMLKKMDAAYVGLNKELQSNIGEHEEQAPEEEGDVRDYLDAYLLAQRQRAGTDSTFTTFQLLMSVRDLFLAGSHTVMTTLRWGLLFMLKYPHVLRRVQAEIDDVIGRGRLPCMADQDSMPYTRATIAEVQRVADIVPLNLPHCTTAEIQLGGYVIPASTMIIANLTAILNDPKHFPEPEKFRPERHLDERGDFVQNEALIPFSIGRRVCPGEALARVELFIFFTGILQNFDIRLPDGVTDPSMDGNLGFVWMANPYLLHCVARQ
ncbi:PREDICTED: cytochrome P450 2C15-like isoform X3 [Priapulus caudatus]|uniref:Cytochrome P450 2C15-like isoform X3 n=1 Tax=Priapulus caudatus TaxID=37621 RepID=A0ABM1EKT0_PRICU|nr:PREDICTED: cytochrome P450 2C15-like isoform X3 [Priapulus caudatus]